MKKYQVKIYNNFWNKELQKSLIVHAENELEARNKGYEIYCRGLVCYPLAQPYLQVTEST